MKTLLPLLLFISVMIGLIIWVQISPGSFEAIADQFQTYSFIKFIHVLSVTMFFSNAVIGTLWELRSMASKELSIIRYTYSMVRLLDAWFTAPLIIVSAVSGILLARMYGGIWSIGWISVALTLFLGSGLFWLVADVPTQYNVKTELLNHVNDIAKNPGPSNKLMRLLKLRMLINVVSLVPLTCVFYLMVNKPEIMTVVEIFKGTVSVLSSQFALLKI